MSHLDLDRDQLDAVIADVASRAPQILPVLRAVRDSGIGYVEVYADRARVLRQGKGPMVVLVPDPQGGGPSGFDDELLGFLLRNAGAVLIIADALDEEPYQIAAEHCTELRRNVVIVETVREKINAWSGLAYDSGRLREDVVAFVNEPELPEGLGVVEVGDIPPPKPRERLN